MRIAKKCLICILMCSAATSVSGNVQNAQVNAIPTETLRLDPSRTYQTMIGFGGALTWYSDWVFRSRHANEINQLIFEDLGLDFLRLQNFYSPNNYPDNKGTAGMEDESIWESTTRFYQLAKKANPKVKVMLSSWGPPPALKSNDNKSGGTLKKVDGQFVYDDYAQYWVDTFDHLPFIPDYLSIQNEPGWIASWTTCGWRPSETEDFPGYDKAIDAVYNALKDRPVLPKYIGPEVENIGSASWDDNLNTFREFTKPLKTRDYVTAYAYHLYNIGNRDKIDTVFPEMNMIRDEFDDKPNFMTEYSSDFAGWLETARIIQNTLIEANLSAYIHWNMVWETAKNPDKEDAMISINWWGSYTVNQNYYVLKHFAKYIDIGYVRIELTATSDPFLRVSAFISPDGKRLVIQAINAAEDDRPVEWSLADANIDTAAAVRTTEGNFFVDLGTTDMASENRLPAKSLTTYILDLNNPLLILPDPAVFEEATRPLGKEPVASTFSNPESKAYPQLSLLPWLVVGWFVTLQFQ